MPKTLLLADDSVTIQKVVGISFANEDIELVTVDNGDDAVDRARELRPDIILADVVMPGKTGYQVCEAIKDDPELAHIPVVLLTGTFETFDETRAAQVRADGHITKPFEAQALVDQVNSRLAQASPATPVEPEPDALGLTDLVTPAEAADQSYDLFEDEVTAPSGVSPSPATTTILMGGDEPENPSAQTWVEDFGATDAAPSFGAEAAPPAAQLGGETHPSAPPFDTSEADPVLASGDPIVEADRREALFEDAAPATGAALFEDSAPISDDAGTIFDDAPSAGEQTILDQTPLSDSGVSYSAISEPSSPAGDTPLSIAAAPAPDQTEAFLLDEVVSGQAYVGDAGDDLFEEAADDGATRLLDTTMPPASVQSAPMGALDAEFGGSTESAPMDSATASAYDVSSTELEEPQTWAAPQASPVILPSEPDWPQAEASEAGDAAALGAPSPAETIAIFPETNEPSAEEPEAIHVGIPLDTTEAAAPEHIHRDVPSALSPMMEKELRDGIEKLAWDAFGDLSERIVKDAVERIEQVAWEVIPKMAETLVREEIRKLKEDSGE